MKRFIEAIFIISILIILSVLVSSCSNQNRQSINGAGASFPYPVYSQWAFDYKGPAQVNYQSIGSGAGISQIKNGVVDFGATDEPLTIQELDENDLIQIPMLISGIVISYNLTGVNNLKLSPDILVDIFLGKITEWNDQRIVNLNPNVPLEKLHINVIHRADGSGTTYLFTKYLSEISDEWKEEIGCGKSVMWPVGVGSKGNEGIAVYIQQLENSIGYIEYSYALQNQLIISKLLNPGGNFVTPNVDSFGAASDKFVKSSDGIIQTTNRLGPDSWPITGLTYILLKKKRSRFVCNNDLITAFFDWGITTGSETAKKLGYIPYPHPFGHCNLIDKVDVNDSNVITHRAIKL